MGGPRLNLVVLHVADIEPSRRFYEAIGLTFAREQHGQGPAHYACQTGETVLELYPRGAPGASPPSRSAATIGFSVPSPAAVLERLKDLGGPQVTEGSGERPLRLVDPDGHVVFLTAGGDD